MSFTNSCRFIALKMSSEPRASPRAAALARQSHVRYLCHATDVLAMRLSPLLARECAVVRA
jgi:hypothetical protein